MILTVEGLSNLADAGGHPLSDGRRMAAGRLFRAAAPTRIDATGLDRLSDMGIATVVDLRGTTESGRAPSRIAGHGSIRLVPAPIEPKVGERIVRLSADDRLDRPAVRALMIDLYREFVADLAPAFGTALATVLRAADRPVMVNCTAGKDRTGFLVAVIQTLVGVDAAAVRTGYLRTNTAWDRAGVDTTTDLPADAREAMLVADADYLDAAFDEIARRQGTVAAFAGAALGSDAPLLARLDRFVATTPQGEPG